MRRVVLTHQLELDTLDETGDGAGGFVQSWTHLGTLWGGLTPRSGRLANSVAGAVSVSGVKITVRGIPVGQSNRPKAGQRFRLGARVLRIEAVTEADPGGKYLICHCEEEVAP